MVADIYEVSVEVEPLPEADFPEDCEGAFVYCYAPAESLRDSLEAVVEYLENEGYEVIDIDRVTRLDLDDYEPEEEDAPSLEELQEALEAREVITGPFDCYEEGDDS